MKKFFIILFLFSVSTGVAFAQEEELGVENGPDPGDVPVDGGLSLLLAAGAAYGGRKLLTKDREKKS